MVHGRWSTRPSAICHQPLAISHDVLARRTSHSPPRTSHVAPLHFPTPSLPPHLPMYTRVSNMSPRRYLPALFLLFVGSGCAALIYEIVWFLLLQRLISARQHPLRVYAGLELGIGVLALLILIGMPLVGGIYTAWAGEGLAGIVFRGVIAGICLLPPTILMGATLPAISRWVKATPDGVAWLGFFYGGNIGGGVIGCLVAGFYLLRVFDVATATLVAVAINVAVALIAYGLAARTSYE